MSQLTRATDLAKRPVVTLTGEDIAQIKDVVYDATGGALSGFTLNGRGLFAGPLKVALPLAAVTAIGPDAVMIADEGVLVDRQEVAADADVHDRDVLGNRVVTDTGTDIGTVVDVILQTGTVTDVVGYEVEASPAMKTDGRTVFIPLPDALSVSGEALIVPNRAVEFASHDLTQFGSTLASFRKQHGGGTDVVQ